MELFPHPPVVAAAAPPSSPPSLPPHLVEQVQLLLAEYAGALAPSLVVAIAETTAAALRALGVGGHPGEDFLAEWHDTTRRRLSDHVVLELASVRRAELARAA